VKSPLVERRLIYDGKAYTEMQARLSSNKSTVAKYSRVFVSAC
jgi:hypothetical protein